MPNKYMTSQCSQFYKKKLRSHCYQAAKRSQSGVVRAWWSLSEQLVIKKYVKSGLRCQNVIGCYDCALTTYFNLELKFICQSSNIGLLVPKYVKIYLVHALIYTRKKHLTVLTGGKFMEKFITIVLCRIEFSCWLFGRVSTSSRCLRRWYFENDGLCWFLGCQNRAHSRSFSNIF